MQRELESMQAPGAVLPDESGEDGSKRLNSPQS
jgi:hypothetical protein